MNGAAFFYDYQDKQVLSIINDEVFGPVVTVQPVDSLQEAIDKGLLEGLAMTHREILKVFEKFNVKPISAKGQLFDPAFHEAVMQEESGDYPDNTVINELQKGYLIHERLLRPSMVVVAKFKEKNDSTKP